MCSSSLIPNLIRREAFSECGPTPMRWRRLTVRLQILCSCFIVLTFHPLGDLIENFIESLKLADLTPKRFLLQTGAKHYGFHVRLSLVLLREDSANISGYFVDWTSHIAIVRIRPADNPGEQLLLPSGRHPGQILQRKRSGLERSPSKLHNRSSSRQSVESYERFRSLRICSSTSEAAVDISR